MRIRTVKPEMWTDGKMVRLSDSANLLFIALLNQVDDKGRMFNDSKEIECRAPRFWGRVDELLKELAQADLIEIYGGHGQFMVLKNFLKHQVIDRPRKSTIPRSPSENHKNNSANDRRMIGEHSTQGKEGKGRERIGKESKGKETAVLVIPEELKDHTIKINEWLAYKRERGENYKPTGLKALWRMLLSIPSDQVAEAIDKSMASNWAGIFPQKGGINGTSKSGNAGAVAAIPGKYSHLG